MIIILAATLGLFGSYLLYVSWKRHSQIFAFSGWGCLLATLPLWVMNSGAEYGIVFALSLPAIFVWVGIFSEQKKASEVRHIERTTESIRWNGKLVIHHSLYVIYHLILLMFVSSLLVIALVDLLPLDRPTQLATGIILLPLAWAFLSFWHLVSSRKKWPLLFSVLTSTLASIYLFV